MLTDERWFLSVCYPKATLAIARAMNDRGIKYLRHGRELLVDATVTPSRPPQVMRVIDHTPVNVSWAGGHGRREPEAPPPEPDYRAFSLEIVPLPDVAEVT